MYFLDLGCLEQQCSGHSEMNYYTIPMTFKLLIPSSYAAVTKCWEGTPDNRPNFSELVVTFSSCLEDIAGYIDFSPDPISKELPVFGYDHLIPTQPEN